MRKVWWYEEFAANDCIRSIVLNGMIFALLGIYEYYKYTNNDKARLLFEKGISSLKYNLHNYDSNGYSYYDILRNPPLKYHEIHVKQLAELYDITKDELFKTYHDRWKDRREPISFKMRRRIKSLIRRL